MYGEMKTWKKSESQMGFEPTTLRDLVGFSTNRANNFVQTLFQTFTEKIVDIFAKFLFTVNTASLFFKIDSS